MFCKPFYLCSVFINLLHNSLYCGSGLLQTQYELMALTDDRTVHCGASVACPFRDGPTLKCSNENAANALHIENRWLWALVWNVSPLISPRLIAAVLLVFVLLPAREPPFITHLCFPSSQRFYFYVMKCRLVWRWQTEAVQLIQKRIVCYSVWGNCWIPIKWNCEGVECFNESHCRNTPTLKVAKPVGNQWFCLSRCFIFTRLKF